MEFSQTGFGDFAPGGTCSPAKQSQQLDIGGSFLRLPLRWVSEPAVAAQLAKDAIASRRPSKVMVISMVIIFNFGFLI